MLIDSVLPLGLLLSFALLVRRRTEAAGRGPRAALWQAAAVLAFAGLLLFAIWVVTSRIDLFIAGFAALLTIPGVLRLEGRIRMPALDESPWVVAAVGVFTAATVLWVWGGGTAWNPVPVVHDEAASLLQAQIFASGRWTAPGRPLPEFFEQMHVFVTPFLAAKYPPGHALALTPGVWLGRPVLVPVVSNGVAGALVFILCRRLAGGAVAFLAWLLWFTAPGTWEFRASYLSETTTTVLVLTSWWALWRWREDGARRWLFLLAAAVGWGAITRPLTMFAFAVPIAVVVLRESAADRSWVDLAAALLLGAAILAILPLWSLKTTGEWRTTPYRYYSQVYFPYEWAGFGAREEKALRSLPASVESFERQFKRIHREHTVRALPETLVRRLHSIGADMWGAGRGLLALFAILGAVSAVLAAQFAVVSSLTLVVLYLYFAHSPAWTPYYLEAQPVLAFLTAFGLSGAVGTLLPRTAHASRRRVLAFSLVAAVLLAVSLSSIADAREDRRERSAYQSRFREAVERLCSRKCIIFVRYGAAHDVHRSLVENVSDLEPARAWIVHDLGDRNENLTRLAPDRSAYLYDDERRRFLPLPSDGPS